MDAAQAFSAELLHHASAIPFVPGLISFVPFFDLQVDAAQALEAELQQQPAAAAAGAGRYAGLPACRDTDRAAEIVRKIASGACLDDGNCAPWHSQQVLVQALCRMGILVLCAGGCLA